MRKLFFLFLIVAVFGGLFAEKMQPIYRNAEFNAHKNSPNAPSFNTRDVPDWEFSIDPTSLITNYYDYQPGSYNSCPIRIQEDAVGGGIYMIFHGRETAASTRRVYYAYVDSGGNVTNVATISTGDLHEGYPGIDLDPLTGDPIVTWHVNIDESTADLEIVVSYDLYHLGSPGLWKTPFIVIDDNTLSPLMPADEFTWPYSYIGPSPFADKQRVYVIASNGEASPVNGNPSENNMIAYADFDVNDFNAQSELNWTYRTIPLLDDWHAGNPEWVRPTHAIAVDEDGTVALFGYTVTEDATTSMADKMYVLINDNYGEGDFTYQEASCHYPVDNPLNQDGTPAFPDEVGDPQDIYFAPYLCNHQNMIMSDNKLFFLGNMNMLIYPDTWYPDIPLMYPKIYQYDITNNEFSFQDLFITGAVPDDNSPMLPWDLDEDGVVDEFDPDGYVMWQDGWPIYHFDNNNAFDENHTQMTKNEERGWLLAIWNDGLKSRYGNVPEPGFEDWAEFPEIVISVSSNNGITWKDPIVMNAKSDDINYAPELDGMIPIYIYPGDKIEDLGDDMGRVHLMFFDDNSYGSTICGAGENLGGTMMYAAVDIDFSPDSSDPTISPALAELSQNYPNPFNPTTTVDYNLQQAGKVELEIYNVKGQKVKTLVNEYKTAGDYTISWNGTGDKNKQVASGIYFYKLSTTDYTCARKMIMLK